MGKTLKKETIEAVLKDLEALRGNPQFKNQYAIEENIIFFRALKSGFGYFKWLFFHAPKIKKEELLELTDLPFARWDIAMHKSLVRLERQSFPGLIKPLVKEATRTILSFSGPIVIGNFGSGGMEAERQIINRIHAAGIKPKIIFVGFDNSPVTHGLAKENLKNLPNVEIEEIGTLTGELLAAQKSKIAEGGIKIILCKNDIFGLDKIFAPKTFNCIFHTLFKHHLTAEQQVRLENIGLRISQKILEYDGFKHWFFITLPHTITAWDDPVFLNATIFSDLRYSTKRELADKYKQKCKIKFFKVGTYLLEYSNKE